MKNKLKLVYIEWGDAISNTGWMNKEDILKWGENNTWLVKNIGWVIKETKLYILLASKYSEETNEYGLIHKIPRTWIKVMKTIKI